MLVSARFACADQQEALVYENRGLGISLQGPPGWCMYKGMKRRPDILAVFSRLPYTLEDRDNPKILLLKQKAVTKGPDSPLALARRDLEVLGLMKNLKNVEETSVLEEPNQSAIGGRDCAEFSYEIRAPHRKNIEDTKGLEYIFLKDGSFYIISCGARSEFFDKYRGDFDQAVKSFILQ